MEEVATTSVCTKQPPPPNRAIQSRHPLFRGRPKPGWCGRVQVSRSTVMHADEPLLWVLQALGLFIAFTVQGAMWKGAQDHGGRGWAVALTWAAGSTVLFNAMHLLHDGLFPHT